MIDLLLEFVALLICVVKNLFLLPVGPALMIAALLAAARVTVLPQLRRAVRRL